MSSAVAFHKYLIAITLITQLINDVSTAPLIHPIKASLRSYEHVIEIPIHVSVDGELLYTEVGQKSLIAIFTQAKSIHIFIDATNILIYIYTLVF
jgi:hypothetical protein